MKELQRRYLDFLSEYDPYYQEEPEQSAEEMFYNLKCMKELNDLEPAEIAVVDALIEDLKKYMAKEVRA